MKSKNNNSSRENQFRTKFRFQQRFMTIFGIIIIFTIDFYLRTLYIYSKIGNKYLIKKLEYP